MPDEDIVGKSGDQVPSYGMARYGDLFLSRQRLLLLTIAKYVQAAFPEMLARAYEPEAAKAVTAYLGLGSCKI